MLILTDWLNQWLETKKKAEEIARILPGLGLEVERFNQKEIEVEVTPNRGDLLGIYGLAREISAKTGEKMNKLPFLNMIPISAKKNKTIIISPKAKKYILRLSALKIENVQPRQSSKLISRRLAKYDINSINHIIDATNYIMLELGQPLHAFDYDKISGKIIFRLSKKGESITTIDGTTLKLPDGLLVGESSKILVDLVGIQGGADSSVSDATKNILLVAGVFDPKIIRLANKITKHNTPASYRYERGTDYLATNPALRLASSIIGGDCKQFFDFPRPVKAVKIPLDYGQINKILGTNFSDSKIKKAVSQLFFDVKNGIAEVPSFRQFDVASLADIAEEVARIAGYEKIIPQPLPKSSKKNQSDQYKSTFKTKLALAKEGLQEVITYSFISQKEASLLGLKNEQLVEISNPLSQEHKILRPNLKIGLLKVLAKNPWNFDTSFFEIGRVFKKDSEQVQIGFIFPHKKLVPNLLSTLKFKTLNVDHPILKLYKIRRPLIFYETELSQFLKQVFFFQYPDNEITFEKIKYCPVAKFAPVTRDISFIIKKSKCDSADSIIKSVDKNILLVELFDRFSSTKLFGAGKVSLAYHIVFDSRNKKLTNLTVNKIMNNIEHELVKKLNAKIR